MVTNDINRPLINLENLLFTNANQDRRLNVLFAQTLRKISVGEAYRTRCMAGTNYSKFGWWMRTQQRFLVMTDLERRSFARQVNDVHLVYTDWETIVVNLTHPDMVHIDVRKL